jgi:hypothetical protein
MADADLKRGTFLGALGGIAAGVASFIHGFFAITAKELLKLLRYLQQHLVTLVQDTLTGLYRLGRALAKALRSLGTLTLHGVRRFVLWASDAVHRLSAWLKDHFAPVLRWLQRVKDEFDKIYKRFIRPILDVLDFIHLLNRTLQALHISVLQGVDDLASRIQTVIDRWVQEFRGRITTIENWIDRIITLDGFLQRVTLILSLERYASAWMRISINARKSPIFARDYERIAERLSPPTLDGTVTATTASIVGDDSRYTSFVEEFAAQWRIYLKAA